MGPGVPRPLGAVDNGSPPTRCPVTLPYGGPTPDGEGDRCAVLGGPGEAELAGAGVHAEVEHALAGDLRVLEHDQDGQPVDQGGQAQGEGGRVDRDELAGGLALAV